MKRIGKAKWHFRIILLCILLGIFGCILLLGRKQNEGEICVNEVLCTSFWPGVEDKIYPTEWIELYNGTEKAVNLKGFGLSDTPDQPLKWTFPDTRINPGGYVVVYTETYTGEGLKTNFNLQNKEGYILLSDPLGQVLDTIYVDTAYDDVSVGRFPDGGELAMLKQVSPGTTNNGSVVSKYIKDADKVREFGSIEFSQKGGYYQNGFSLELKAEEGETILYTLDGSEPDFNSMKYKKPIEIKDRSDEENLYAGKGKTSDQESAFTQFNDAPVTKGTVVRARLARDGILNSKIYTETYFVGVEERITSVSLVLDPEDLFGYEDGIYTRGKLYKWSMRTEVKQDRYKYLGNYSVKGEGSQRIGHIEFFSKNGKCLLEQNVGVRLGGGAHRRRGAVKTWRVLASEKYDDRKEFRIPFWTASELETQEVSQLILRSHQDFINNTLSDVFITTCFFGMDMGIQAYEPAVLYLNGEFWGLAAVRERIDDEFLENHFSIPKEDAVMLKPAAGRKGGMEVEYGNEKDCEEYGALTAFVKENDMTLSENYEYITEQIDVESFIKNWWAHIFFSTRDWPDNNFRVFRSKQKNGSEFSDGKWRYILYDMDFGCVDYVHNTLLYALGENLDRGEGWRDDVPEDQLKKETTELFSGLMKNARFRDEFLEYYLENRTTLFDPDILKKHLDEIVRDYQPYLDKTEERWTRVRPSWLRELAKVLPDSLSKAVRLEETWGVDLVSNLEVMYEFIENRRNYMDQYVEEYYESVGESVKIS